jgi:hypothetical protein
VGRGKSQRSIALINAALAILAEIQPATIRAVCYRLFTAGVIGSMEKKHTNRVSTQLVWAREQEHLDWGWIVDETRAPEYAGTWDDPEQVIEAMLNQYRKDRWSLQPQRCEVWSEKGTVRGTLAPVLDEYGITFRVMHGYGSATAVHQAARESRGYGAPLQVFYVGDWDPSGLQMSEVDLPARLNAYGANVTLERIALDRADVTDGELPSFDAETKRGDTRYAWYTARYGTACWELDALSPVLLRERVEQAITRQIDREQWDRAALIEQAERESLSTILGKWQSA